MAHHDSAARYPWACTLQHVVHLLCGGQRSGTQPLALASCQGLAQQRGHSVLRTTSAETHCSLDPYPMRRSASGRRTWREQALGVEDAGRPRQHAELGVRLCAVRLPLPACSRHLQSPSVSCKLPQHKSTARARKWSAWHGCSKGEDDARRQRCGVVREAVACRSNCLDWQHRCSRDMLAHARSQKYRAARAVIRSPRTAVSSAPAPGSLSSSCGTALPALTPLQLTARATASTASRATLRWGRAHGRQRHGGAPPGGTIGDAKALGRSGCDRVGEGTTTSASVRRCAALSDSARVAQAEVLRPNPRGGCAESPLARLATQ